MTREALDRARRELGNIAAAKAKANGDVVLLHLLAAAEEAAERGENNVASHLLCLCGFRQAGRDSHVCEALGDQMRGDAAR